MSDHHRNGRRSSADPGGGDFQAAVSRLERAVQALVSAARDQFSDRATTLIDETTNRLEAQLGRQRSGRSAGRSSSGPFLQDRLEDTIPRKLYLDPKRQRIVGVCAGIARYYGVEPWVVRCIAVTGLLFFPSIVFPAYWVAWIVMEKPPAPFDQRRNRPDGPRRRDHHSPAPELGSRLSPRNSLRHVQADLMEVELRLRRMETHVTSGRYELQRELNRIDPAAAPGAGH
ncbi:MAG: PspC domain-containing protein [Pseudomonadales bacterium]